MNIDHENTARALKDQPLFATNQWLCAFGIHTWLQWGKVAMNRRGSYSMVEQYRSCGCCGKTQRRMLSKEISG